MDPDKLDRQLNAMKGLNAPVSKPKRQSPYPDRYARLADDLNGELVTNHAGTYCLVRTLFPFDFQFGDVKLSPVNSDVLSLSAFSAGHSERVVDGRSIVFFDTETTGLGGSGAVAFLIGIGSLCKEGFEIRQYLLPDYSDEAAMLEDILEELSTATMVSYNGQTFDLPVVRDRMVINRVERSFAPKEHIDLLHPTRRLYRRRLQDCTLTNIEREIFGFHREDDIPGYLIPSVYFSWLSEEMTDEMSLVLEHNRYDILTLNFLLHHLHEIFATNGESLDAADDIYSLSRVYGRRKQNDVVVDLYRRLESSGSPVDDDCLLYHAMAFKRSGQWPQAIELWHQLTESDSREGFLASIELAKYFEHQKKDFGRALEFARRAGDLLPDGRAHRDALTNRIRRLQLRVNGSSLR